MFVPEFGCEQDGVASLQTGGVGDQLAQMVVIGGAEQVLDDHEPV